MIEAAQHVGASALQGSAELGQLFRPSGTCGARGVDDRLLVAMTADSGQQS